MKTFVINMETAHARRERIAHSMTNAGIRFEFFRAVTPADEPQRYFAGFDNWTIRLESHRKSVTTGEVACFASHLLLWQKCASLGEPIVILEDDVEPTASVREAYAALTELTGKYGFIRLDPPWPRPYYFRGGRVTDAHTLLVVQAESLRLIHPTYVSIGAGAYAISPAAAIRLLDASLHRKFSLPVDNFFRQTWRHRQPMFYLEPSTFIANAASEESQISGRQINRPDSKFIRKIRKLPLRLYQMWARHACRSEADRIRKSLALYTTNHRV